MVCGLTGMWTQREDTGSHYRTTAGHGSCVYALEQS